jgi:hypothetical protein
MLFYSIGLPSRFAEWCDLVVLRLAQRVLGSVDLVSGNTLDEVGLAVVGSRCDHLVIGARQPVGSLRAALTAAGYPFVVALHEPCIALQNLVTRHGLDVVTATRAAATSCATMVAYAQAPSACLLRASEQSRDPISTAAAIADCFGVAITRAEIGEIVASLADPGGNARDDCTQQWWEDLAPPLRRMAAGALNGYADPLGKGGLGELRWTGDLFFLGDDPSRPACGAIELAGGIRNLLFGPYIALPVGNWGATVTLAISKEAIGVDFGIEVIAGPACTRLAYTTEAPDQEGVCRAALIFDVGPETAQPICLRVANMRFCWAGRLALVDIRLTPYRSADVEISAEIAAALGL